MKPHTILLAVTGLTAIAIAADERKPQGPGGGGRRGGPADEARFVFKTEVPAVPLDVILARPTNSSMTVSVRSEADREVVLEYGPATGRYTARTKPAALRAGEPQHLLISGLQPDTRYFYRLQSRSGNGPWQAEAERSFTTQRSPGKPFTFTVQADSHLDFGTDVPAYRKSLANVLAARADFHVDLGDTFMTDKYPTYTLAAPQYAAQRYYFGLIGHSVPVFLVLGNHDGETIGKVRGNEGGAMAMWSNGMRKRYFANPIPDGFYTGNTKPHPQAGPLENYYAWEWGDGLFIALDQFWYSERPRKNEGDNWSRTLGREQYDWLRNLLESSKAKFTFVFTHHLVGGETPEGRGGVEASHFFEWGGHELDGRDTFAEKRPGWAAPIHDLLAKRRGCVVFHGHDHLYVHGERDGVTYQLVPQPGHERYDNTRSAEEYGYKSGVVAGASGIMRVTVSPEKAVVDYVRAYPDEAENATRRTGSVSHSYEVRPR